MLSVVTLGVADLKKARTFYEGMGLRASSTSSEHFVAFHTPGIILSLFSKEALAKDAGIDSKGSGFKGVTLAHNVSSKELVREILAKASSLGALLVKEPEEVFWGGYSGYFQDLDGHLWEVAFNPHWEMSSAGLPVLPK